MIPLEGLCRALLVAELGRATDHHAAPCSLLQSRLVVMLTTVNRSHLLVLPHERLFKRFTQSDALFPVRFILDQHLVYLSHFDRTFDLFDFDVAFVEFSALLADGPLIAVYQLLSLSV